MKKFIKFVKEQGLDNIEQLILNYNIDWRNSPNSLLKLRKPCMKWPMARRQNALWKKLLKSNQTVKALLAWRKLAVAWNHLELAKTTLEKVIGTEGADGAKLSFKDPMLLPVSKEKPTDQNPSVGVVLGMLCRKVGESGQC